MPILVDKFIVILKSVIYVPNTQIHISPQQQCIYFITT